MMINSLGVLKTALRKYIRRLPTSNKFLTSVIQPFLSIRFTKRILSKACLKKTNFDLQTNEFLEIQ